MAESDFWSNEIWVVLNRINAWSERYRREDKAEIQRLSLLGSWLLAPHKAKGKPRIKPSDLAPPVWSGSEAGPSSRPLTEEEREEVFAKHDRLAKKIFDHGSRP
jgi:hypothetical protein